VVIGISIFSVHGTAFMHPTFTASELGNEKYWRNLSC